VYEENPIYSSFVEEQAEARAYYESRRQLRRALLLIGLLISICWHVTYHWLEAMANIPGHPPVSPKTFLVAFALAVPFGSAMFCVLGPESNYRLVLLAVRAIDKRRAGKQVR